MTAVCFDFTNGFHDTANAVATSIATGALKPRVAVAMSAVLNLVGAFVSIKVAATIAKGIVNAHVLAGTAGLSLVFAALIGATIVASSASEVKVHGLLSTVIFPALFSPIICGLVAMVGTFSAYRLIRRIGEKQARKGYRYGQIGSAALVSLAHGTNDAQKTMGVIALALIAHGDINSNHFYVPLWVKISCATAIALGTAIGGWRIINTMGNRLTDVESPQGFSAEAASASVILASSYYGYPLSTTQVVSGGVLGSGLGKKLASVHWGVVGQMATAWVLTIPAAAVMGGVAWEISRIFGRSSAAGSVVIGFLAAVIATMIFQLAQRNKIGAHDLDRSHVTPETEAELALGGKPAPPVGAAA